MADVLATELSQPYEGVFLSPVVAEKLVPVLVSYMSVTTIDQVLSLDAETLMVMVEAG